MVTSKLTYKNACKAFTHNFGAFEGNHEQAPKKLSDFQTEVQSGVISRGLKGQSLLVKTTDHSGGLSPLKILVLALFFKVY